MQYAWQPAHAGARVERINLGQAELAALAVTGADVDLRGVLRCPTAWSA